MDDAALIATVLSSITTIALAIFAFLTLRTHRVNARHAAVSTWSGGLSILISDYLDRTFKRNPPTINGRTVEHVRDARDSAWDDREGDVENWNNQSLRPSTSWHNRVAYELAIALERIGISVFTGPIPANVFVALAADQVLEDWLLCRAWIKEYQSESPMAGGVAFHRRHAEWLALLAALWMHRTFPEYPPLADVIRLEGDIETMELRFKLLSDLEHELMPPPVRSEVATLTGIRLHIDPVLGPYSVSGLA